MLSPQCRNKVSVLSNGQVISTVFYEDLEPLEVPFPDRPFLMVARANDLDFDKFMAVVGLHRPLFVVPPFNRQREDYTSMAAERTRAQMPKDWDVDVGTVLPSGRDVNQVEFLAWATQNDYAPIVIPPDPRRPRAWQLNQFSQHRVLVKGMWYHLAGDNHYEYTGDTIPYLPGIYTWGVGVEQTNDG